MPEILYDKTKESGSLVHAGSIPSANECAIMEITVINSATAFYLLDYVAHVKGISYPPWKVIS